jgi:phage terminase small subunit
VLTRLANELEADVADLFAEDGSLLPARQWPPIWRQGLVVGLDVTRGADGVTVTKARFSDRIKRLELMGKHVDVRAFAERHEHGGSDGGQVIVELVRFAPGMGNDGTSRGE